MGYSRPGKIQINHILVIFSKIFTNFSHYRKAVGALLVYDITKKFTFTDIQRWLGELRQYAEPDCIVMLVGNKFDLIERNNRKREVTYEEAKAFAEENKLLFYETSALSSYKVNDCFEDLLQDIYNERRKVTNVHKQIHSNVIKLAENNKLKEDSKCC